MTLTDRSMEWLNHNRYRSYPMRRDEWREKASPESRLDCVLLDALVFNADASGSEELILLEVDVVSARTRISMKYGNVPLTLEFGGGSLSGDGSFRVERGVWPGSNGLHGATYTMVFSSHAYILDALGEGRWVLGCPAVRSRVVNLVDGMGVDRISVNGSAGVDGHDAAGAAYGDVVLEDGYRTSPVIYDGKVLVRVGKRFGLDPCKYDYGTAGSRDCRRPMFFFCGQNAINGGNVLLKGGRGVSVVQGRSYTVNDENSKCNGKTIPCIEIVAGQELLDMYRQN